MKTIILVLIQIFLSEEFYPTMTFKDLDLYKNKYNLINNGNSKWPILKFLSNQVHNSDYKLKIKTERNFLKIKLKKNYKYISHFIHSCLKTSYCKFKKLRKYLEFACIIARDNDISRYCDLINTISLLEYCSLNFLLDSHNLCKIARIKNIINIKFKKCTNMPPFDDSIQRNYCKLFFDRSIDFLLEILTILNNNNSNQIYYSDIYKLLIDLLKLNMKTFLNKTNRDYNSFSILMHRRLSNSMVSTRMKLLKQISRG